MVDADKDGALSKTEMANALQIMRKMRQQGQQPGQQPAAPKPDAAVEAMKQQATGGN
jgi:hypothetical protein